MKKRLLVSGIVIVFLLSLISAQETAPDVNTVPEGKSVTIDGIISSFEWTDAERTFVELKSNDNQIKYAQRYYKYNEEAFYFALVVNGKSEEVFFWIGDDEEQAFQKGTDIKRVFPDGYTCQDVHYRGLYDMVTDSQQDCTGAGVYDSESDKTTVELAFPFDSGDENDYIIEPGKIFTIIYGSIHRTSPDKEYKKTETVSVPVPRKTPPPHKDLDICSCINVKVSASKIKHYLWGIAGYKSWTESIGQWGAVDRDNLAAINVEVSLKDIKCCGKWKGQDEIKGVTAKITCNTRYGKRTNSASVFRYRQLVGTQEWYNTACSMTNIYGYIKPGWCKVTVEANGQVCFSMSFIIV
ncbi:MAG: hypothetical protein PVF58_18125 [Candidatus Methanofastidiosia archaeon]|jgi:hypothetical protein